MGLRSMATREYGQQITKVVSLGVCIRLEVVHSGGRALLSLKTLEF
jgi:hypothetical protein